MKNDPPPTDPTLLPLGEQSKDERTIEVATSPLSDDPVVSLLLSKVDRLFEKLSIQDDQLKELSGNFFEMKAINETENGVDCGKESVVVKSESPSVTDATVVAETARSNRPHHTAKPPVVVISDKITTLSRLITFIEISTNNKYANDCSTLDALVAFVDLEANAKFFHGTRKGNEFRNGFEPMRSRISEGVDKTLLVDFINLYREVFALTPKNEREYWRNNFERRRVVGSSISTHMNLFRASMENYNSLTSPAVRMNDAQQIDALTTSLCLDDPCFIHLPISEWTKNCKSLGEFISSVSNHGANLVTMTKAEGPRKVKLASQNFSFLVEGETSSKISESNGSEETELNNELPFSHSSVGATSSPASVTQPHGPSLQAILQNFTMSENDLKVFVLGPGRRGVNLFPARSGLAPINPHGKSSKGAKNQMIRKAASQAGKFLQRSMGNVCTRCLRKPDVCNGGSTPQCANPASPVYSHNSVCNALRLLFGWATFPKDDDVTLSMVAKFHESEGETFGNDAAVTKHFASGIKTFGVPLYTPIFFSDSYVPKEVFNCKSDQILRQEVLLKRALSALPDTGNPEILAGKCWWNEYYPLLEEVGLGNIAKASSDITMGFGDGPQTKPLFVALQVPLWYETKNGKPILVFTNVKIIENSVGILGGKSDLSAMHMAASLSPEPNQSEFQLYGSPVVVDDSSHFFLKLARPRPLSSRLVAQSLQRHSDGIVRSVKVLAKKHHGIKKCFDARLKFLSEKGVERESEKFIGNSFAVLANLDDDADVSSLSDSEGDDRVDSDFVPGLFESISALESELDYDDDFEMAAFEWSQRKDPPNRFPGWKNAWEFFSSCANLGSAVFAATSKDPTMSSDDLDKIRNIAKIHRQMSHPTPSQLLLLLSDADIGITPAVEKAIREHKCEHCTQKEHRIPSRPSVAIPVSRSPGQVIALDCGYYDSPHTGKFVVPVATDSFSLLVTANGSFDSTPNAEDMSKFLVHDAGGGAVYARVTYDLQGAFDSDIFRAVLMRIGSAGRAVPANAHWPNQSEKSVELLRKELKSVWFEQPSLSNSMAIQAAVRNLNSRIMPKYGFSRMHIHRGWKPLSIDLAQSLVASSPPNLPPSLEEVQNFIDATSSLRNKVTRDRAQLRVKKALAQRVTQKDPLILENGDEFLFYRVLSSAAKSGFRGPAQCIGQAGSLVVGYMGGRVITAHNSRCVLHRKRDQLICSDDVILPKDRDISLESELPDTVLNDSEGIREFDDLPISQWPLLATKLPFTTSQEDVLSPFIPQEDDLLPFMAEAYDEFNVKDASIELPFEVPREDVKYPVDVEIPLDATEISLDTSIELPFEVRREDVKHPVDIEIPLDATEIPLDASESVEVASSPIELPFEISDPESFDVPDIVPLLSDNLASTELPVIAPPLESSEFQEDVISSDVVPEIPSLYPEEASPPVPLESLESKEDNESLLRNRLRSAKKRARENVPYESYPEEAGEERDRKSLRAHLAQLRESILFCEEDQVIAYDVQSNGIREIRVNLVDQSRKRTVVVDFDEMKDRPEFVKAMETELKSFYSNDCVEEVLFDDVKEENLVSTKWVLTIKTNEDGSKKYKARLVARGFEDSERLNVERGSPVASTPSQRLIVQACVEKQWKISSWDYLSAFLQGQYLARDQQVILQPPRSMVAPGIVWRLKKPVYGLVSAPKAWYDKLCEVVLACGFDSRVSDEGIFRLFDGNEIIGILALHVDDTMGGGTKKFHETMDAVGEMLLVGSKETENFHYKGLRYQTIYSSDGTFYVALDGDEYIDAIVYGNEPEGNDDLVLSVETAKEYQSCAGVVGFVASSFRPDVPVECSVLGRSMLKPTKWDMIKVNSVIRYMKENRFPLIFKKGAQMLTVFCDSAGPNERGTQGGRIFALTDKESDHVACWLYWESRKIKRKCRSTGTAETLSMDEGRDTAMWIRKLWSELTGIHIDVHIIIDSEGVSKNAVTTRLPTEKRLRIDLACIRQGLRRGEFFLSWAPSWANLSDPLTKESESEGQRKTVCLTMKKRLLEALRSNRTLLHGVKLVTRRQEDVRKY